MIYHWPLSAGAMRLHVMTGTFVIHTNFGALSAAVMTCHYMEDCSTI